MIASGKVNNGWNLQWYITVNKWNNSEINMPTVKKLPIWVLKHVKISNDTGIYCV